MPAPTNIDFLTATDLGVITTSITTVTQAADFGGTTYPLYYTFVAPTTNVYGVFALGDLSVYMPTTSIWTGPAAGPSTWLGVNGINVPLEFPTTAGDTYFIKVLPNGGNPTPANLTLEVYEAVTQDVQPNSLMINGDRNDFPALILSSIDGTNLRWLTPFPAGEGGDSLLGGQVLIADEEANDCKLYDSTLTTATTVAFARAGGATVVRASLDTDIWFVGNPNKAGAAHIATVDTDGAIGAVTWDLPTTGLNAIATSRDDSILYHAGQTAALGSPIGRWDLNTDMALSDLVAGIANHRIFDILVLADDTILAMYCKPSATQVFVVKHYSALGVTLHTYTLAAGAVFDSEVSPRLCMAADEPLSFWAYVQTSTVTGVGILTNVTVATGVQATTFSPVLFNTGEYKGTATLTPLARFGPNPSCPLILLRSALAPPTPAYEIVPRIIRRLRRVNLT